KRDCAATPRWTPRYGVLGRPDRSTAIEAPCVLASRRPSNRVDEHRPAKPSSVPDAPVRREDRMAPEQGDDGAEGQERPERDPHLPGGAAVACEEVETRP